MCNTTMGICFEDGCENKTCAAGQVCKPPGNCVDGCEGVTCPGGQECKMGSCTQIPLPDGGVSTGAGGTGIIITGRGGSTGTGGGVAGSTGAAGTGMTTGTGGTTTAAAHDRDLQVRDGRGPWPGWGGAAAGWVRDRGRAPPPA